MRIHSFINANLAPVAGINSVVGKYLGPADTLIAYLPLAHIFEFALENAAMFWGTTLGYGTSKTLTDASMKNCKGDIRELKPTLMVGVPAVWESVKKGIVARVEQQGIVARSIFWAAFAAKSWMLSTGIPGWGLWDNIIFGKVREATGGRLRLCANGAGPISRETQRFISLVVTPMILGYGMTETIGYNPPKLATMIRKS
jgi:long-chain acyl-CoA synthetase